LAFTMSVKREKIPINILLKNAGIPGDSGSHE